MSIKHSHYMYVVDLTRMMLKSMAATSSFPPCQGGILIIAAQGDFVHPFFDEIYRGQKGGGASLLLAQMSKHPTDCYGHGGKDSAEAEMHTAIRGCIWLDYLEV